MMKHQRMVQGLNTVIRFIVFISMIFSNFMQPAVKSVNAQADESENLRSEVMISSSPERIPDPADTKTLAVNNELDIPGVVTLLSPSGEIDNWSPTFSWDKESVATKYLLYVYQKSVDGTITPLHYAWHTTEEAVCEDDDICSIDPGLALGPGTYYWMLRGKGPDGKGPWSVETAFNTPPKPVAVIPLEPSGEIDNWSPEYSWESQNLTTKYQLSIYHTSGELVYSLWYTAEQAVCSDDDICSIDPGLTLVGGEYYWKVRGRNPSGKGPWSEAAIFNTPPKPGVVTTLAPNGDIDNWSPEFSWDKESLSTKYQLYVYSMSGDTPTLAHFYTYTSEQAVCDDDNICSIDPALSLGLGTYYWKVRGRNPSGKGPWSDELTFNTPPKPGTVTLQSPSGPSGDLDDWSPTFAWDNQDLTTKYQLYVYQDVGGVITPIHSLWYTAESAVCDDDDICSINPGLSLGAGPYYWMVRGRNLSGKGPWCDPEIFNTPPKPGVVTVQSPSGDIDNWSPIFSWDVESVSTKYQLYVYQNADGIITPIQNQYYTAEQALCDDDDTCSIDPGLALGGGTYYWKVRGRNPSGKGTWNTETAFNTPPAPGDVVIFTPDGVINTSTPVYSWTEVEHAVQYQ
ncbi:MAG: hypothetical protein MUO76_22915, partial [Anaerolineaceae bacterium]|nr:hypothetical protein [Anaerolineaceae bacterium]